MQEMLKVVGSVKGTVAAPPESDDWLKLPSGEVSLHSVTFSVFQKMVVREPSGTEGGTAQMSTRAGRTGADGAIACTTVGVAFCTGVCVRTTEVCVEGAWTGAVGAGVPTVNPPAVQSPSKKEGGMIDAMKPLAHGRVLHHPPTRSLTKPPIALPPKKVEVSVLPCVSLVTKVAPVPVVCMLPVSPGGVTVATLWPPKDPVTMATVWAGLVLETVTEVVGAIVTGVMIGAIIGVDVGSVPLHIPSAWLRASHVVLVVELAAMVVDGAT